MSTEVFCFLFGIPAAFLWVVGVKKGIMLGAGRIIRRDFDPPVFVFFSALYCVIVLGLLLSPIVPWIRLRAGI
jgi:hypothetical protein